MTITFSGIDNEFALATGSNIGTTANTSTFDGPPSGSTDLVIASLAGDDDPLLFEVGDTYDVSWGGQGGGGTMLNAVVIRSDPAPDGNGGGVIVLEGVDENGDPAQVVWTPNFDLEGWYNSNYSASREPQFYTEDRDASYDHSYVCFAAGTLIDTAVGRQPVETLRPGDLVMTLDEGPQPVIWIGRRDCLGFGADAPVTFAAGTLGNDAPLTVSRQHRILIRSAQLDLHYGHSEALAAAKAFVGLSDVRYTPRPTVSYIHVLLQAHHLIRADGALCESLFVGDSTAAICADDPAFAAALHAHVPQTLDPQTVRPVLRTRDAARFLAMYPPDMQAAPSKKPMPLRPATRSVVPPGKSVAPGGRFSHNRLLPVPPGSACG